MWLENADCTAIKLMLRHSPSMYLVSTLDGRILWANNAFCDWSQYTVNELTKRTWMELSSDDADLKADIEASKQLNEYDLTYVIQKRYIPKNGKPQLGNLHVTRYPASGPIEFCWCRWEPLVNGTAQAFELAITAQKSMSDSMDQLTSQIKINNARTEEENWILYSVRMVMKHPRVAMALLVGVLALGGFDSVLSTLQRLGFMQPPPIIVKELPK